MWTRTGQAIMNYDESREFDTIELSLSSGLSRLRTLKNLEMIDFKCINHLIGRPEPEWMAASWPNFDVMHGLHSDEIVAVAHGVRREELREYFQELRPNMVCDSFEEAMRQCSPY